MWDRARVLWELMRGQRLRYALALIGLLVGIAIGCLAPLVCQVTLDAAISGKPPKLPGFGLVWLERLGGPDWLKHHLVWAAAALVALTCLSGLFLYLKGRWAALAAETIARRLRDRLYDHLQHLPCSYHDGANPGDLVQRCTSDVETVKNFLSTQVIDLGRAVLMLATVIPLMLWLDWRMTLVSLAVVPPIVVFSSIFFVKVRSAFKLSDEAEGEMTAQLQENLTGIRVVRAFARQEFEEAQFAVRNAEYRDRTFRLIYLLSWFWTCSDFMCTMQNGLVLLAGGYWVAQGTLTVGTLYAFLAYVNMFLWPVRMMGRVLSEMGKTHVSLGRLQEILTKPREADGGAAASVPAPVAVGTPAGQDGVSDGAPDGAACGELVLERVSFAHGPKAVLHEVTLRIAAGETVALLGPSGSGKSTLIQLLLRFYDYPSGSIRLDGRELKDLPRKWVRARMAAVLQEPFLFSRNLRENIRLGRGEAGEEEIRSAAAAACIHDSIQGFEHGYDTVVGERGVMLSGGQRQRVALARAFVREAPVLLLDDALSAVDTETEVLILKALEERRGRRTTIVIAHRLSTLMQADRIAVLEHGRITQLGNHESLLREPGLYVRLWQIQGALEEDLGKELEGAAYGPEEARSKAAGRGDV